MTERLQLAIDFMKAAHRSIGQTRKDGVRLYEVHPLEVTNRVAKVTDDEDILIAALFHDILEDVEPHMPMSYGRYTIQDKFGIRVLAIVLELTDAFTKEAHPNKNRATRKQLERERYAMMSPEAKLVKLADIAANLSDDGEVLDGGKPEVGFNRMFIKEKELCLPYLFVEGDEKNLALYQDAIAALIISKVKFDVR